MVVQTIPFVAVESGDVNITSGAEGDNLATVDPGFVALTIEPYFDIDMGVADDEKASAAAKSSELPATGNPLVLLALALLAIVPVYRRD